MKSKIFNFFGIGMLALTSPDINAVAKFRDKSTMNGVAKADVKGARGDSGGPVFLSKSFHDLIGIIRGEVDNNMYFTRVDKITTKYWGYTRY